MSTRFERHVVNKNEKLRLREVNLNREGKDITKREKRFKATRF